MPADTTPRPELLAARAWRQLQPTRAGDERIQIVRKRARSTVYRIEGAGPGGASVIAKRSRRAQALIERTMYEQILPSLAIPALAYYGFVDEAEGEFAWLFIGCAGDEPYSTTSPEHTALAARWLSLLHTAGAGVVAAALLPGRGPGYYQRHLTSAHRYLRLHLGNPALSAEDRAVLEAVITQCEALACHWGEVERRCEALPMTLVHGDFAPKNMRVRHAPAGLVLDAYDWGSAGWGVPALDLAQAGGPHEVGNDWPSPDLEVYRSGIRDTWSTVDKQDLEFCAALGKAFRCVYCIDRESEWLGQPSIDKAMWNMRLYCSALGHVLRVTGWR